MNGITTGQKILNWEVFVFIVYLLFMLGIGLNFFFKSKGGGDKSYFLGGRQMGPWVTALSAQASDMSAWLLMGLPGSILAFGFGQIWIGIGLAMGTAANWIFCAGRLRRFSKAAGDSIRLVVPEKVGRCRIETVPAGDLLLWLRRGGVQ